MAEVSEFKGIRYNPDLDKDMAHLICPPYDVISPQEQQALYDRDEFNMVRLEYGMELKGDTEKNNRYRRARDTFNKWLKDRVLIQDTVASFYVHEHSFELGESKKRRLGLFACVRLEPWEKKVIFPHEFTMAGAKADRLKLMETCSANFSPVFGLYEDPGGKINQLILNRLKSNADYTFSHNNDNHRLWVVNEPEFVQRVSHFLAVKSIYIADGHHRYETALAYRDQRRKLSGSGSSNDASNFVMMSLTSFSDPGIVILPIHRLLRGLAQENLDNLLVQLPNYFDVTEIPSDSDALFNKRLGTIRLYGLKKDTALILNLLPGIKLNSMLSQKRSDAYCNLDVSIVQHIIIEKLLGLPAGDCEQIAYTPSGEAACRMVDEEQFQFAVILDPIPPLTIKKIADANDRMPRKSTFFYPKLPTGLIINRLDGQI